MKRIFDRTSGMVASILSSIIAMLGFSACGNEELMYGTPTGTFEVKGTVTDSDGSPMSGAYVIHRRGIHGDQTAGYSLPGDTAVTGSNGSYILSGEAYDQSIKLVCKPNNNEFEADSTNIPLRFTGGNGEWDKGHADAIQDFTLRKKPVSE